MADQFFLAILLLLKRLTIFWTSSFFVKVQQQRVNSETFPKRQQAREEFFLQNAKAHDGELSQSSRTWGQGGLQPDTLKNGPKHWKILTVSWRRINKSHLMTLWPTRDSSCFSCSILKVCEWRSKIRMAFCVKSVRKRTLCSIKSSLKMAIEKKTTGKIDILNKATFPRLNQVLKGVQGN